MIISMAHRHIWREIISLDGDRETRLRKHPKTVCVRHQVTDLRVTRFPRPDRKSSILRFDSSRLCKPRALPCILAQLILVIWSFRRWARFMLFRSENAYRLRFKLRHRSNSASSLYVTRGKDPTLRCRRMRLLPWVVPPV
jgi:hypothetical protein